MLYTQKTLATLEYDKIIDMLTEFASTPGARARARSLLPSDDYESSTKFALVYKKLDFIEADGAELFECKITLREPAELADILNAAAYFGAEVCKVHSLPLSSGGRENSFDIIFGLDGANIAGLFCYLMLKYPHLSPVGLYTLLEVW